MPVIKRREREKEEMKEMILSAAEKIAEEDGFESVSVRKIAKEIEYSPSIIYHYFEDMDEITNSLIKRGYNKIVTAVSKPGKDHLPPEERLKEMVLNYIDAALKMPAEFMAVHMSKSEQAMKHTASLYNGASGKNVALAALCECVKDINSGKEMDESEAELRSQIIVVSTVGLIIKLIVEENIGGEQKRRLIEFFVNNTALGMAKKINE